MYEIWRVCKPGTIVEIIVPNAEFLEWAIQPTHVRFINKVFFEYWSPSYRGVENAKFNTNGATFKTLKTEIFNQNREIRFALLVIK